MDEKEMKDVLEITTPSKAEGVILGEYKGNTVCMPKDTKHNRHRRSRSKRRWQSAQSGTASLPGCSLR